MNTQEAIEIIERYLYNYKKKEDADGIYTEALKYLIQVVEGKLDLTKEEIADIAQKHFGIIKVNAKKDIYKHSKRAEIDTKRWFMIYDFAQDILSAQERKRGMRNGNESG